MTVTSTIPTPLLNYYNLELSIYINCNFNLAGSFANSFLFLAKELTFSVLFRMNTPLNDEKDSPNENTAFSS